MRRGLPSPSLEATEAAHSAGPLLFFGMKLLGLRDGSRPGSAVG